MDKLTAFFGSIRMAPECEEKILAAAEKKRPPKRSPFRPIPAICASLALILLLSSPVRAAVENWITITFPGLDLIIYEKVPLKDGDGYGQIIGVDTNTDTFAYVEKGRLIFTGNGENQDITHQVSEDSPFYYTYHQDEYEVTLVVAYSESVENFGVYTFIKENGEWFTASGRNFWNPETDTRYPWVDLVWETLGIPWPLPE